jgi:hypothetical protein
VQTRRGTSAKDVKEFREYIRKKCGMVKGQAKITVKVCEGAQTFQGMLGTLHYKWRSSEIITDKI